MWRADEFVCNSTPNHCTNQAIDVLIHDQLFLTSYIVGFTAECAAPPVGTETELPDSAISYTVGETFEYVCNPGFQFADEAVAIVTCQSDGKWSSSAPECEVGKIKVHRHVVHVY